MKIIFGCFGIIILSISSVFGQNFEGTWVTQKALKKGVASIQISIAKPENNVLYPAHIHIEYKKFKGTYEVLLAKRDANTLGIGRDKISLKESPFYLGDMMVGWNGYLQLSNQQLTLQPIDFSPQNYQLGEIYKEHPLKKDLKELLYQQKLTFEYKSAEIDENIASQKITNPSSNDYYYGVYRPITVQNGLVTARVYTNKNLDNDSTSLNVNGDLIFDKIAVKDARLSEQINLKKGINTFVFFADNFGKIPPNSGILKIFTEKKSYEFPLNNKANQYGTFLVAQIDLLNEKEIQPFENSTDDLSKQATKRINKHLGKIVIQNPNVKLEIWDAQEEDGDSVSIGLNDQWIAKNVAVKNKAKTISLNLKSGKNTLLFMAQNLGAIPPNTAFVKLKFDRQERIIEINTDLQKNNIIEMYYKNNDY